MSQSLLIVWYLFPGSVPMKRVNWEAKSDCQFIEYYKVLQVSCIKSAEKSSQSLQRTDAFRSSQSTHILSACIAALTQGSVFARSASVSCCLRPTSSAILATSSRSIWALTVWISTEAISLATTSAILSAVSFWLLHILALLLNSLQA